tara:strand:+ start:475 stop:894 length:420 start_codon:yes stop_codon:yes gene_type:complete
MIYTATYKDKVADYGRFTGEIESSSMEDAIKKASERGLGEIVTFTKPSNKSSFMGAFRLFSEDADEMTILHEVIYVTYLGLKSGVISADESLSDTGYLHDLVHYFIDSDVESLSEIEDIWVRYLECASRVPGIPREALK